MRYGSSTLIMRIMRRGAKKQLSMHKLPSGVALPSSAVLHPSSISQQPREDDVAHDVVSIE